MKKLKVRFIQKPREMPEMTALFEGMKKHGDMDIQWVSYKDMDPCDIAVTWGHRNKKMMDMQREAGADYLILERGYIGDRFKHTSLGFNGLNGEAEFPHVKGDMPAQRFAQFKNLLTMPIANPEGHILLLGQVRGDASHADKVDITNWYYDMTAKIRRIHPGKQIVYRPHPLETRDMVIENTTRSPNLSLIDDLNQACMAVTFNSNSAVESVLAGVPVYVEDKGSMAYNVALHSLENGRPRSKDRLQWAINLSWCQWTQQEMQSGLAWEYLKIKF